MWRFQMILRLETDNQYLYNSNAIEHFTIREIYLITGFNNKSINKLVAQGNSLK